MRSTICFCLMSVTVLLGGCSRGQDDHDGQYSTDTDGRHFHPRIPFQGAEFTSEAQKLIDDFVGKHRADGAIQNVKVESARVDGSYTGILNADFAFSGKATVTITGTAPFTVEFRERVEGSFMTNNNRLLENWFYPFSSQSSFNSAYVLGLDSWRSALAAETDQNNVGYRIAQALSVCQLIIDLKDHADPGALDAWQKANAIAWDQRARINLPLQQ
jgi:hypothetical protein